MDDVSLSYYDNDDEYPECIKCLSERRSEIGRVSTSDTEVETGIITDIQILLVTKLRETSVTVFKVGIRNEQTVLRLKFLTIFLSLQSQKRNRTRLLSIFKQHLMNKIRQQRCKISHKKSATRK